MTIGEKIKYLREQAGLTQTDIAKKIGIATQTIFKYEKNIVTNIPLDNIEKLAEIFNVSPAYLMGWESDREKDAPDLSSEAFALWGEIHDLTEAEKKDIMEYIKFKKNQRKGQ